MFSATKAYSATNSNNLNLSLVISTAHLTIGQTINMTASVNNTLASLNNVSAASSYRFPFLVTSQASTADPSPVMTAFLTRQRYLNSRISVWGHTQSYQGICGEMLLFYISQSVEIFVWVRTITVGRIPVFLIELGMVSTTFAAGCPQMFISNC